MFLIRPTLLFCVCDGSFFLLMHSFIWTCSLRDPTPGDDGVQSARESVHVCLVGFGRNGLLVGWFLLAPEEIMKTSFGKESAYHSDNTLLVFPVAGPVPSFTRVSQPRAGCLLTFMLCLLYLLSADPV